VKALINFSTIKTKVRKKEGFAGATSPRGVLTASLMPLRYNLNMA